MTIDVHNPIDEAILAAIPDGWALVIVVKNDRYTASFLAELMHTGTDARVEGTGPTLGRAIDAAATKARQLTG